jgi:hypothetical protein
MMMKRRDERKMTMRKMDELVRRMKMRKGGQRKKRKRRQLVDRTACC